MELVKKDIIIGKKVFPGRIHIGEKPEFIFVTHHGLISTNNTFKYFEDYVGENGIVVSYDARVNGQNTMKASRMSSTYARDLNDVIIWAKSAYPGLKVITLGSSWGAAVVIQHAKMFPGSTFRTISWSIPYNMFGSNASKAAIDKSKVQEVEGKKLEIKETSPFGYAWRFALMLPFNINTKSYTKVDLNKTVNNRAFNRLEALNKPKPIPVKLFYSCYKSVLMVNKNLRKISNRPTNSVLYIQSTKDSYLKQDKLNQLKQMNTKSGLTIMFIDEGHHALQWEKENDLNIRVFDMCMNWIKKG